MSILIAIAFFFGRGTPLRSEEATFGASPYRVKVLIFQGIQENSAMSRRELAQSLTSRCRSLIGPFWSARFEFDDENRSFAELVSHPPDDWSTYDKVFGIELEKSGGKIGIGEYDVTTSRSGHRTIDGVMHPAKTVDLLIEGLFETFSPVARLEKATSDSAVFRLRGIDTAGSGDESSESGIRETIAAIGIPMPGDVLLPFVRTLDREGRPTAVSRIPWTVLIAEDFDRRANFLHCRLESGLRDPLGMRRRGRTELFAIRVDTPMIPTTLRLVPRMGLEKNGLKTMPPYDVFEISPDDVKGKPLGRTSPDGSFILEPLQNRSVRTVLIKSGRSPIARLPIVRGLERQCEIPVPDDVVRLEAESALLGIQEELIDVTARRNILMLRLKRFEELQDEAMIRRTRSELSRLKTTDRFLFEIDQARKRFKSEDPVVQRRIGKMFRDTENAVRGN